MKSRRCANAKCDDVLAPERRHVLCPACQWIGNAGFWIGSVLTGSLVALVQWWIS